MRENSYAGIMRREKRDGRQWNLYLQNYIMENDNNNQNTKKAHCQSLICSLVLAILLPNVTVVQSWAHMGKHLTMWLAHISNSNFHYCLQGFYN